jgi:hypothetical protein
MREIKTETYIHASSEEVWKILVKFDEYAEWNPFIRRVEGDAQVGARLEVEIEPPGGRAMTFQPIVLRSERSRELRWLGHLWQPGLLDGEHVFCVEPLGTERVRFVQRERFTGLLGPMLLPLIGKRTRRGFEAMNEALKARVETPSEVLQQAA